jgi:hypothetical protein
MAGMNASIEINRPVEKVYGFFVDLEDSVVRTERRARPPIRPDDLLIESSLGCSLAA